MQILGGAESHFDSDSGTTLTVTPSVSCDIASLSGHSQTFSKVLAQHRFKLLIDRKLLVKSNFRVCGLPRALPQLSKEPESQNSMARKEQSPSEDVELLLLNASLRDELEPLYDESIGRVNAEFMSTQCENEFLASMLEWERAPTLPISQWFTPELILSHPDMISEDQLHEKMWNTVHSLYEKRIVLDFTDHLTDRELYCLIYRDILPSHEKKIDRPDNFLHWDCANVGGNADAWLRYYASEEDRQNWLAETDAQLPPREEPLFRRRLPRTLL